MKIDANRLMEVISDSGFDARAYSGRGMYGTSCVSFTTDEAQMRTIAEIIESCDDPHEAAVIMRGMTSDSMGLDRVYYWPKVAWPEA